MRALVLLVLVAIPASARAECKVSIDPSATPAAALPAGYLASISGIPAVDKPGDVIAAESKQTGLDHYVKLAAAAAARSRVDGSRTTKADQKLAVDTYAKALLQLDGKTKDTPDADLWRFDYGLVLLASGQADKGRNELMVVVKDHPDSRFVPLAYAALGDQQVAAGKADAAEPFYQQVLKYQKSPAYWYAMFQDAYLHLAKQQYQDALEMFFQVVRKTQTDPVLSGAARTGFVIAYAPIGKVDKAEPAFQRVDSAHVDDMLEGLAIAYERSGAGENAKQTYTELVHRSASSERACAWNARLAELAKRSP